MKRARLLQIIKEEVANAINEIPGGAKDPNLLKEMEQLAEKASMRQLKKQLKKQNREEEFKAVEAAEKTTLKKLSKDPVFSGKGNNQRLKGYVKNLKKELEDTHNINLQNLLSDVAEYAEKAGEEFNDDISANTIEKNAANKVLGKEPGKPGKKKISDEDPTPETSPEPTTPGKKGRKKGSKNLDLTSLLSTPPEEEPEAVGSEDEEWYKSEEDEMYGDMERLEKDEEASLKGLEGWEDDWDDLGDDEF